jgi:hypothetical protein
MENTSLTKQRILSELSKSPHGKLAEYIPIGKQAIAQEPEFAAHLLAWDRTHGQIRDSKVALPVVTLAFEKEPEFVDNAFAHLALLGPRELLRSYEFAREIRPVGQMLPFRRMIGSYLAEKEESKGWDHLAIQHRKTLKTLYALSHALPAKDRTHAVLFGFKGKGPDKVILPLPKGSVFEAVANLKNMTATEAAGTILKYRVPFLIAMGALGSKAKDVDLVMALINAMSATELVTNTKMLEKLGVKTNPALRSAFETALAKASTSKKNTLKTTAAIDAIEDEGLKDKLRGLQDKQIAAAGGPEGNWLVLADKSGSMSAAIELARHVSATLAKFVKGKVYLVFFDVSPLLVDVTGLSLDQIQKATRHIHAAGGTSIGVGLNRLLESKIEVDGIAIVSDGGENTAPLFGSVYPKYSAFVGKDVPVYFYDVDGRSGWERAMSQLGIEVQTFKVAGNTDYYSIMNTIPTLRTNRYSLIEEILQTPLLSLNDVLKTTERKLVNA